MDDVTCVVTDAPCVAIGAPNVTLELNGFTMTGQADPQTACNGGGSGVEIGIDVNAQIGVDIRGPGLVKQFRGHGIRLLSSSGATITGMTTSTNCFSGIFVVGGSDHHLHGNLSVRNGNASNPCAYDWLAAPAATGSVGTGLVEMESWSRETTSASVSSVPAIPET